MVTYASVQRAVSKPSEVRDANRSTPKADEEDKVFMPVDEQYMDGFNNWGEDRGDHTHDGEDFPAPAEASPVVVMSASVDRHRPVRLRHARDGPLTETPAGPSPRRFGTCGRGRAMVGAPASTGAVVSAETGGEESR